ncbi:MAG: DNA-directed RNA polymerase subunit alpha [Anaerolineae bacterium]|nr:DNA-directed RNA polymerase subunit alpha [Anaerolineae bacterium]
MVDKVFPKIEATAVSKQYGRFVISPLESGYGLTLGNALRRVLLSSLSGAAATSVRVMGVQHEFSPIPNAREDMTTLMLNLKQVRFRLEGTDSGRARLRVRGPAEVTAGDLEAPAGIDVLNPEQHLLTLDSGGSEFEMEVTVSTGKGYSPSEERGSLPIGEIPLDAIFSPIRRATYSVERERVGPTTDFDRLVIEVWTDGTVSPEKALSEAAQMLVEHFQLVTMAESVEVRAEEEPETEAEALEASLDTPIEALDLNVRAYNCLKRAGISTVGQVLSKLVVNENELLEIRNFGRKSLEELKEKLTDRGLYPPPEGFQPTEVDGEGQEMQGEPAGEGTS